MAECCHAAWVQICGTQCNCSVIDTFRLQTLVRSLPNPRIQTPSLWFFLGQKTKDDALRYIFPHNNIKKTKPDGLARIRVDNTTTLSQHPVLFADADLAPRVLDRHLPVTCHEEKSIPVRWQCSDIRSVTDHVFARVLLACSNVFIVFADDFRSLDHLTDNLVRWINIGVSSDAPPETRPRLLIVIKGQTPGNQQRMRQLYRDLEIQTRKNLTNLFSLVSTQYLEDGDISSLARYRPLREGVLLQADEMRTMLIEKRWLFTASHLASLFGARLFHTASTVSGALSVVETTRKYHQIPASYADHLRHVIAFGKESSIKYENTTSYIGSSILMDAYPVGAHLFDPSYVFQHVYSSFCLEAFIEQYPRDFAEFLTNEVQKQVKYHYEFLLVGKATSAELHMTNLKAKGPLWADMKSNSICLPCLMKGPQHGLTCGHSICDVCVSKNRSLMLGLEYHFEVKECMLCDGERTLVAKVRPPTSGARILSIDGGGTRGVIPLEFLRLLQDMLGKECNIRDYFDLAVGTSSGGLTVLIMFLYEWGPEKSSETFDSLARQLFRKSLPCGNGTLSRIQRGIKCWVSDSQYEDEAINASLQSAFGDSRTLFGYNPNSISGLKVAVTASSISDASCFLFTNYNSTAVRTKPRGYSVIPHNFEREILIWEAARATSAAPMLFTPAQISSYGSFQDGGLIFNNPVDVATSEARSIGSAPDVVLSLGTGTTEVRSPKAPYFRNVLNDGFVPRLCRSFVSSLDGQRTWRELVDRIDEKHKTDFFRLNVSLDDTPPIDDTSCMNKLRNSVKFQPTGASTKIDVILAITTASFFFELDSMPHFESGLYRCEGSIYCRNHCYAVIQSLIKINGSSLHFTNDNGYLTDFDGVQAVCSQCHRYRKRVVFYTKDPSALTTIYLKSNEWPGRRISGFPQSIEWFIEQQRLDAAFGAPDCIGRQACIACERALQKRNRSGSLSETRPKRRCRYMQPRRVL